VSEAVSEDMRVAGRPLVSSAVTDADWARAVELIEAVV
jgi:hypothetical protein